METGNHVEETLGCLHLLGSQVGKSIAIHVPRSHGIFFIWGLRNLMMHSPVSRNLMSSLLACSIKLPSLPSTLLYMKRKPGSASSFRLIQAGTVFYSVACMYAFTMGPTWDSVLFYCSCSLFYAHHRQVFLYHGSPILHAVISPFSFTERHWSLYLDTSCM